MKKLSIATAFWAATVLVAAGAFAGGHYPAGVEAYKASNMITEGGFYKMYNIFVTADKFTDNRGNTFNQKVDVFTQLHRFGFHITHIDAIGADLIMDFAVPIGFQRLKTTTPAKWSSSESGLGDILFEPVLLSWHGERYDALATLSIFIPTGHYDKNEFSTGQGFWSFIPTVGVVYYLDEAKSWTVSALGRYEINTERDGVRHGDSVVLEWAVGKNFGSFDLALAGADKVQVRDNSGRNATTNTRDRMHAIGPELVYTSADWGMQFSLRSMWEYETANNPKGNMTTLSIVKPF